MPSPSSPPRVELVLKPTPLHRLERMSARLGVDLWMKRDDLTGFALGGNKGRKLEYLLGAAKAAGATAVVTCGATQSNFLRQLATGCAVTGLKCAAAVMGLPYEFEPATGGLVPEGGNLLLTEAMGADLRRLPDGDWDTLIAASEALAREYEARGERVYRLAIGGSSPLGALAFYEAAQEVPRDFDWIVSASSSGSTQTGLTYAFHGSATRVKGIACDPEPELVHEFVELAAGLDGLLGRSPGRGALGLTAADFDYDLRFVGPGYGVPSAESFGAIRDLARTEGILLDPIYTGKAFAGLLETIRLGEVGGRVLFWHTGGAPSLFCLPEPERLVRGG